MSQKVLLLTKNYPPQIGGMEKYAFDLHNQLIQEWNEVRLIMARPRNEYLLARASSWGYLENFFYIISELFRLSSFAIIWFFQAVSWCTEITRKPQKNDKILIWSADASIAWLGLLICKFSMIFLLATRWKFKTRITGHGRDIALDQYFYQKLLKYSLRNTDEIYAVSGKIKEIILNLWIPEKKITIHEHTLTNLHFSAAWVFDKILFLQKYGIPEDKILLFSIGRFVEKKWFHWFVAEVLPFLSDKFFYVLAGDGPFREKINHLIAEKWLSNIVLLWAVKDSIEKARLYSSMNYFIMPNIHVEWDCEGYGIVLLESQFYNLRSIVANVDGIDMRVTGRDIVLPSGVKTSWIECLNLL